MHCQNKVNVFCLLTNNFNTFSHHKQFSFRSDFYRCSPEPNSNFDSTQQDLLYLREMKNALEKEIFNYISEVPAIFLLGLTLQ